MTAHQVPLPLETGSFVQERRPCEFTFFILFHRTSNAGGEVPFLTSFDRASSSSANKIQAAPSTERFFKLLGHSTRKFSRSQLLPSHALASLKALRLLFRLPNSRPLLKLSHKMKLVDPTLSAFVEKLQASEQLDASGSNGRRIVPQPRFQAEHEFERLFEGHDDEDEDEDFEEALLRDFGSPMHPGMRSVRGGRMLHSQGLQRFLSASGGMTQPLSPSAEPSGSLPSSHQETTLLSDLRELLLPFASSAAGVEGSDQLDSITQALNAAVTGHRFSVDGSISGGASALTTMTALSNLRDVAQRGALSEMLGSPAGLRLINALCAFMGNSSGLPGSTDSVLRRQMFRSQFCSPQVSEAIGESKHAGLKALLQHALALFEENHNEVLSLLEHNASAAPSSQAKLPQVSGSFTIQLRPIPRDSGCEQHFGHASSTFSHNASSDFKFLAGKFLTLKPCIPTFTGFD